MFYTGLDCYKVATVQNFTTKFGIRLRRKFLNKSLRKILKLCTRRKIIIEQYPVLNKKEVYIFVCNHSFDEDAISCFASTDRNVYIVHGSTHQMEHNPIFLAMWLNGMIYLNRMNAESRKNAVEKMKRILTSGTSVLLFPEGGYNNTENQLIQPLFASPWILSKELGVKVVPLISFNDIGTDTIYIRVGEPMDLGQYEKYEAMKHLRDEMSTIVYEIMEEHVLPVKRKDLPMDVHQYWMEIRKQVYACQKWYEDVWEEEVTYSPGHDVTTPKQAREFVDRVKVNSKNACIFADMLVKREEDKKYDLVSYLQDNMDYAK